MCGKDGFARLREASRKHRELRELVSQPSPVIDSKFAFPELASMPAASVFRPTQREF